MLAPLTSVNSIVSPTVARSTGPGTMESKVQASYQTPVDTSCRTATAVMRMRCRRVVARGGASAARSGLVVGAPTADSPCDISAGGVNGAAVAGLSAVRCGAGEPQAAAITAATIRKRILVSGGKEYVIYHNTPLPRQGMLRCGAPGVSPRQNAPLRLGEPLAGEGPGERRRRVMPVCGEVIRLLVELPGLRRLPLLFVR